MLLVGRRGLGPLIEANQAKAVAGRRPYNKSLNATAEARFDFSECPIGAGVAGQVGVQSRCVRWRCDVSCRASHLIVALHVRRVSSSVIWLR